MSKVIISIVVVYLGFPEAGLFKTSCLAAALGVTKFLTVISINLVLKSDLALQQTGLRSVCIGEEKSLMRSRPGRR
jgi:hypothetical protein